MTTTELSDADITRIHEADMKRAEDDAKPAVISKAAEKAFKRAKRASVLQDSQSRKVVDELRGKREATDNTPVPTGGQTNLFDF